MNFEDTFYEFETRTIIQYHNIKIKIYLRHNLVWGLWNLEALEGSMYYNASWYCRN